MTLAPSNTPQKTLNVSQLNKLVKNLLDLHIPLLWVEGEISNFSAPASGHWYFSLKDKNAQVRCAMFKGKNNRLTIKPKAGMKVRVRANVSLYEGRGDFQIIAEHMEETGSGQLQQQFEALKYQLNKEGLFDEARKKPLPAHPKHIAVITSPTGAAITDVLSVIKRRFAAQKITIIASQVQGDTAPQQLINALDRAVKANGFDVVLLCRGGGSIEDLWAFNNEALARKMANYPLPIVSAVGHEIDFTIADFVADLRAPTPSAAAEILTPNGQELTAQISALHARLTRVMMQQIEQKAHYIFQLQSRITHPLDKLNNLNQRLDFLESRLRHAMTRSLQANEKKAVKAHNVLLQHHPQNRITQLHQRIALHHIKLENTMRAQLQQKQARFRQAASLLDIASPLATLNRGYAIVKNKNKVITQAKQVKENDVLTISLAKGEILATVKPL